MKLLPENLWYATKNNVGEQKIFKLLKNINLSKYEFGMHSLNISGGKGQVWSEIDFLIVTKRAIIGIEVKGGPVRCLDGVWYVYSDENLNKLSYQKYKSPLVQVSDALHRLRNDWFDNNKLYKNIPFVKVAILCSNNRFKPDFPEMQKEYCLFKEDVSTGEILKQKLNNAIDYFIKNDFPRPPNTLSDDQIDSTCKLLRPNCDLSYYDINSVVSSLNIEQKSMTAEQYKIIDMLSGVDRLLIDGGAGTGKTFLLIYAARAFSRKFKNIGVITNPKRLLAHIQNELNNISNIVCIHPDSLQDYDEDYFDLVFIDEGQDLCSNEYLDAIDRVLDQGLEKGKWRWFGDFENQFDENLLFSKESLDYLKLYTGNNTMIRLEHNVRNTPQIVKALEVVSKARVGEAKVRGDGPDVKRVDFEQFIVEITSQKNIEIDQTGILYVNSSDLDQISNKEKLIDDGCDFCQINRFKGLESNYVFVIGLGSADSTESFRDLYYKSVSRSTGACFIVDNENVRSHLKELRNAKS